MAGVTKTSKELTLEGWFWSQVDHCIYDKEKCWLWKGFVTSGGYGLANGPKRFFGNIRPKIQPHRMAWELEFGVWPENAEADHLCHSPDKCNLGNNCLHRRCCNPWHITPVTPIENKNRQRKNICLKHNLPRDCINGKSLVCIECKKQYNKTAYLNMHSTPDKLKRRQIYQRKWMQQFRLNANKVGESD